MVRRILGLVRKEFAQIFRDRALVSILIWAFTAAIYTSGHGRAMEVTNVATAVYDMSRSPAIREFLSHLQPPYFKFVTFLDREEDITRWLDSGKASIVVVIPPDFQRKVSGHGLNLVLGDISGIVALGAALFSFSLWWFRRSLTR